MFRKIAFLIWMSLIAMTSAALAYEPDSATDNQLTMLGEIYGEGCEAFFRWHQEYLDAHGLRHNHVAYPHEARLVHERAGYVISYAQLFTPDRLRRMFKVDVRRFAPDMAAFSGSVMTCVTKRFPRAAPEVRAHYETALDLLVDYIAEARTTGDGTLPKVATMEMIEGVRIYRERLLELEAELTASEAEIGPAEILAAEAALVDFTRVLWPEATAALRARVDQWRADHSTAIAAYQIEMAERAQARQVAAARAQARVDNENTAKFLAVFVAALALAAENGAFQGEYEPPCFATTMYEASIENC